MKFNADRVRANLAAATTEDLLDRATVYRSEMEPEALAIIEAELNRRGVATDQIVAHSQSRRGTVLTNGSVAQRCSFCHKPAVHDGWRWHRLFGKIPLFPRLVYSCEDHRPR
jgi:hypothetical protein